MTWKMFQAFDFYPSSLSNNKKILTTINNLLPLASIETDPNIWVVPKIVVPQNGWFIMENPIEMDDLGGNTPIFGNTHILTISMFP